MLNQFLQSPQLRIDSMVGAAKHFERLNGPNYAREILLNAYQRNTSSQVVLTNLIEVELATGNAADLDLHLYKLLQMRRPSISLLEKIYGELKGDRFEYVHNRNDLLMKLKATIDQRKDT